MNIWSMPTVFNAANERAVHLFLNGKISYPQIPDMIEAGMERHKAVKNPSVEEILRAEEETYGFIEEEISR